MPASAINRFPTSTLGYGGVATVPNKQNEMMERISRRARRLSSHVKSDFTIPFAMTGRSDSMEALLTRLGIIPILSFPTATSLSANLQAFPADRPAATEKVTVAGGTAAQDFTSPNPAAAAVAFTAGGNAQAVTATSSVDAAAKGRALVDILP